MNHSVITLSHPIIIDFFHNSPHYEPNEFVLSFINFFNSIHKSNTSHDNNQELAQKLASTFQNAIQQQNNSLETFKNTQSKEITSLIEQKMKEQHYEQMKSLEQNKHDTKKIIEPVGNNLQTLMDKFTNSNSNNVKGNASECLVKDLLQSKFPNALIEHVGMTAKHETDIVLQRMDSYKILVENKNWDAIVPTNQVTKFIKDIQQNKCCGLFLSQKSSIVFKNDYHIEIIDDKYVCVYLSNVQYNIDKIITAIQIIDYLQKEIDKIISQNESHPHEDQIIIEPSLMHAINDEIKIFVEKKNKMNKFIQEHSKSSLEFHTQLLSQLDSIQLPQLHSLLSVHCNTQKSTSLIKSDSTIPCNLCKETCKNKQGLSIHLAKIHNKNNKK